MSPFGLLLGWLAFGPVVLALAWACMTIENRLHARINTNTPEPLHQSPTPARTTKTCTVPFCDDPVQVNLHVGHDWWTFCLAHGLPYLTGELHREAS